MSDNTPPPQVWPALRANDARVLIRFLVDVIGFEETVVYGEGDHVDHAQPSRTTRSRCGRERSAPTS
jgi:uncharacterized glyoxalase superfamily protein PhnB